MHDTSIVAIVTFTEVCTAIDLDNSQYWKGEMKTFLGSQSRSNLIDLPSGTYAPQVLALKGWPKDKDLDQADRVEAGAFWTREKGLYSTNRVSPTAQLKDDEVRR